MSYLTTQSWLIMTAARDFLYKFFGTQGPNRFSLPSVLVLIGALIAACGDTPEHPPDTQPSSAAEVIDWDTRTVSLRVPGWTIAFCEGEGPFLCVAHEDEPVGAVELLRVPIEQHVTISQVLNREGTEQEALKAAADEFAAALIADRKIGHGAEYQLRANPPTEVPVMGRPGLRLIVEGGVADRVQERIVHYYGIQADSLYLFTATGRSGGGSLGEFAIPELKSFEPVFAAVAAASRVSSSNPIRQ